MRFITAIASQTNLLALNATIEAARVGEMSSVATAIASAVEEQGAATQAIARNVHQAAEHVLESGANLAHQSEVLKSELAHTVEEIRSA